MNGKAKQVLKVLGIGTLSLVLVAGIAVGLYKQSAHTRLEQIRQSLRADGLPLTPAELKLFIPPDEENAAIQYRKLHSLLQANPLTGTDTFIDQGTGTYGLKPDEIAQLRSGLQSRQDVVQLIHVAAKMPKCGFQRDYNLGPLMIFPEYARIRSATRILSAESGLLLTDGKPMEAIRNEELGFRMANHIATEPVIIGKLVAIAIDAITMRQLEYVLYVAGNRPEVAEAVADSVARNWQPVNMADAMRGEVVETEIAIKSIRRDPVTSMQQVTNMNGNSGTGTDEDGMAANLTRFVAPFWAAMLLDTNEINLLAYEQRAYRAMKLPYTQGEPDLKRIIDDLDKNGNRPTHILAAMIFPVSSQARQKEEQIAAQAVVLRSAALVLAYRDRHGKLPDSLEQAMSPVLIDPFSGKPPVYRIDKSGTGFHVYSVGNTGRFDGGTTEKPNPNETVFWYPIPAYRLKALADSRASREMERQKQLKTKALADSLVANEKKKQSSKGQQNPKEKQK